MHTVASRLPLGFGTQAYMQAPFVQVNHACHVHVNIMLPVFVDTFTLMPHGRLRALYIKLHSMCVNLASYTQVHDALLT